MKHYVGQKAISGVNNHPHCQIKPLYKAKQLEQEIEVLTEKRNLKNNINFVSNHKLILKCVSDAKR